MDNTRLFLFTALGLTLFLLWEAWQQDYGPLNLEQLAQQEQVSPLAGPSDSADPLQQDLPAVTTSAGSGTELRTDTPTTEALVKGGRIQVQTDVVNAVIDLAGGDLRVLGLRGYPVALDEPDTPLKLMNDKLPDLFVAQGGLLGGEAAPNHHANYSSAQTRYVLDEHADSIDVALVWQSDSDVRVTKIYTFHRASYQIDVRYHVQNNSEQPWAARQYAQFQRTDAPDPNASRFIITYKGGAISSPEDPYEKIDFDDMVDANLARDITGGWLAMLQHYFVGAWVPSTTEPYHYYTKVLSDARYVIGLYGDAVGVAPGAERDFSLRLYAGPKIQKTLEELAPGLELTVDYGWLWFIAQPLFWLLNKFHGLFGNWGWSIIMVTVLIKAAFFQLSATSYKSMANMRRVQPRMVAIRERYGSDKTRLNKAMMDLYKTEKINPLGGCLPILVQIPVFISLYWTLLESVELRQSPFIFWLVDLSAKDPYYVLPVLMGATMLIQQRLNPAPIDPIQQKVMAMLPIVFTVFFAFFPSGLVLYWVVNNVLSIAQQWVITKHIIEAQPTTSE